MTEPVDPGRSVEPPTDSTASAPAPPPTLYKPPQPLYQQVQPPQPAPFQPAPPYPAYEPPGTLGYTPETVHQAYQSYPGPQPYLGQPYPGQPYYGQPYPPQGYPGQPYPVEPARRSRRGLIIAMAIVVVLAAGGIVAAVVSSGSNSAASSSSGPLPLPTTFGTFARLDDATADRFRSEMESLFGSGAATGAGAGEIGKLFSTSATAVYSPPNPAPDQKLVLIAGHAGDFPDLSPDKLSAAAFGPLGNPTSYPAGAHGGVVECVATSISSITETACVWSDKTSIGFAIGLDLPVTAKVLADDTNSARNTIDG